MNKSNYWQIIRGISVILVIIIHTLYVTDYIPANYLNIIEVDFGIISLKYRIIHFF